LILHPDPSIDLIKAALWHDGPEFYTGDVPANAKWDFPGIKEAMDHAEGVLKQRLNMVFDLSARDQRWLKACDSFELWLWARNQLRMGNSRARIIMTRLEDRFDSLTLLVVPVHSVYEELRRDDGNYGMETDDDRMLMEGAV